MNKKAPFTPFALVLGAIAAGVLLGYCKPALAMQMKPLGDWFISGIRVLIGPIIFFSVTVGIAATHNIRQLGRVGLTAIAYFESSSTLALIAGLLGASLLQPGMYTPLATFASASAGKQAVSASLAQALAVALYENHILQVLLAAILCGVALSFAGAGAAKLIGLCQQASRWLFRIVGVVIKLAPLAAFGAIAYVVGRFGMASVTPLLKLLMAQYVTTALFIFLVLGTVAYACGFKLWALLIYIKDELLVVFGTASSVVAMPKLMEKLRDAGCSEILVSIVIPAGYSFNLIGSNIYLTTSIVFLAQVHGIALSTTQYLSVLAVAMVTSKGASGVAGSAFVVLAATLAVIPEIPESSLAIIVGIERLLKSRSLSNMVGNAVACLAIASWTGNLDRSQLAQCGLNTESD